MEVEPVRGYFCRYFIFYRGVFSKTGGTSDRAPSSRGGYFRPEPCFCWGVLTRQPGGYFGESMALTDTEVRESKPSDKPYRLSDGGSLYLWVTPSSGKFWRWAYTFGGKEKLMSFGKYPDVPLVLARERHAEARKLLAMGVDPMAERKAVKTAEKVAEESSFQSIANLWLYHW